MLPSFQAISLCFHQLALPPCAYLRSLCLYEGTVVVKALLLISQFLTQLMLHPEEGLKVKTLDFSPFSIVSLGRSANDNKQIKMVCSETLRECLYLTPNLQEV